MLRHLLLASFILVVVSTYAQADHKQELDSIAYRVMDAWIKPKGRKARVNYQLYFQYDTLYRFEGASGQVSKKDNSSPMGMKYKSASVAKTFFATMILQLAEEGKLHFDSKMCLYLDASTTDDLLIVDGEDRTCDISVRQLLDHTSGLRDYIFEDWRFMLRTQLRPRKNVSPQEHLHTFKKHGLNKRKTTLPGSAYLYSDTNYLLLALIIEQLTGNSIQQELDARICKRLGLTDTYIDTWDSAYTNTMHQYHNARNVTELLHPSVEFGGGGLICTNADLARFIQALMNGELFEQQGTLEEMLAVHDGGYGLGIARRGYRDTWLGGSDSTKVYHGYGHGGFFGVEMFHLPELKLTFVSSCGQAGTFKTPATAPWWALARECYVRFGVPGK